MGKPIDLVIDLNDDFRRILSEGPEIQLPAVKVIVLLAEDFGRSSLHAAGASAHVVREEPATHTTGEELSELVDVNEDFLDRTQPRDAEAAESSGVVVEICPPHDAYGSPDYLLTRVYRVWFGTDRHWALQPNGEPTFSGEWSNQLTLGCCDVHVPETHKFGSLGSCWLPRLIKTRILGREDDRLTLRHSEIFSSPDDFSLSVQRELGKWKKRTALVFVHGYRTSFRDAALRAAQVGFDLRVDGITAFFSWPSRGRLVPYEADEARVELAEDHFVDFLEMISRIPGIDEINILAHSMGNRLLCRAVPKLVELQKSSRLIAPLGHLVLAAADLTVPFFTKAAGLYQALASHRVTNYSHRADRALRASRALHRIQRVGLEPPIFVHQGIDTISVSRLDLDVLGHGYFAEAEPLLYDINELIHDNKPPGRRMRLQLGPPHIGQHWILTP